MLFGEESACEPRGREGVSAWERQRRRELCIGVYWTLWGEGGEFPNSGVRRLTVCLIRVLMCEAARVQWISWKALLQQACRAADLSMCPKPNKSRRFQVCCPFPTQHTQLAWPGISDVPLLCLSYCTNVKKIPSF